MEDGSIKADFKFESYKIDKFSFEMKHYISLLEFAGTFDPSSWKFNLRIAQPCYSASRKKYIGGINIEFMLMPDMPVNSTEEKKDTGVEQKSIESNLEPLLKCDVSVVGVFSISESRFEERIEKNLVRLQIPAILLPYGRSTITSFLANAGFGSAMLPLVNIQKVAQQIVGELDIQIID